MTATTLSFEYVPDRRGRHGGDLSPSGGTLNVATSDTAAGGYLPVDLTDVQTTRYVVRLTATKDVYIAFSDDETDATSSDMLFLAGTERMRLPTGKSYVSAITRDAADTGIFSLTVME